MKLPNGYGNVSKLSGNRRRPWRARKTKDWILDEESGTVKQQYVTIGYFATRKEALEALANYNQNPYDIETDSITFSEVYEKWSEIHFQTIVSSACRTWTSAYNHSKPLWHMRMKDIRPNHMEGAIRDANVGQSTKQRMKSLYNMLYRYALKTEIVDKNYAQMCDSVKSGKPQIIRIPFSDDEIQALWDHADFPFVDMILVGIYTGWRPQELCVLRVDDIDTENMTMTGGLKTDAGKNRIVPIHPRIQSLVLQRYDQAVAKGSATLFFDTESQTGLGMTYDKYRLRWNKIQSALHMAHRPHDTRHTFITLAKTAGVDEYILKLIVGHAIHDVTEKIYTHRTIEQIRAELLKI